MDSRFGASSACRRPARATPTRRPRRSPAMAADGRLVVGRALSAPGREPPTGPVAIRIVDGRIAAIEPADSLDEASAGLIALPAPTNAHDHGRGLRTLAFGAVDDRLEAWLQTLPFEPKSDPYLSAAVAFARMA